MIYDDIMKDRTASLLLAAIIGLVLLLSYFLWSGPLYWLDDLDYITYAHQMLTGTFSIIQSPYAYGFLPSAIVALSLLSFGINPFAAVLPDLVECIALVALTFLIGRKLYNNEVGVLSAFLSATAPFVIGYTSRALPDILMGVIGALSVYVMLLALESKSRYYLFVAAGVLAGLTVFVKLLGLAFMLAFFVGVLCYYLYDTPKKRVLDRRAVFSAYLGLLLPLIAYLLIFLAYTGNPLFGITTYGQNQAEISHSGLLQNVAVMIVDFFGYSLNYSSLFGTDVSWNIFPLGFVAFWAIAGAVIAIASKKKEGIFLAAMTWILPLYLYFGTVSLTSYTSIFIASRYFAAVAAPMAVLASYAIFDLSRVFGMAFGKNVRRMLFAGFVAVTILSNLIVYITLYNYAIAVSENNYALGTVSAYIEMTNTTNPILVDSTEYVPYLEFLSGYRERINAIRLNDTPDGLSRQIAGACDASTPTYAVFAYDSYLESNSLELLNNTKLLIPSGCTMTKVASSNGSDVQSYAFNAFDLNTTIYKINKINEINKTS